MDSKAIATATDNAPLQLAWQFVEKTGIHIFLTGKAGTGKTTFLKELKKVLPKRMVVVAPTGVAAINAGGVTIHSFFQLPLSPFIPEATFKEDNKYSFSKEKKNIIRSLDLLVIDEISMVRADLLDAVDAVLRRYKDRNQPFGGVQLLMIGDLQQLAPVVKEAEWQMLRNYYTTPYFFGSRALAQTPHVTIELQKVYRQTDLHFVNLLNQVRENRLDALGLQQLNRRYLSNAKVEGAIRLTTHNATANAYNEGQMALLPGPIHSFEATVSGTFPDYSYPAEEKLVLKIGCQVMFLKNDTSGERRYYNGKLGVVETLTEQGIQVRGLEDKRLVDVTPETWTNAHYVIDKETKEISEEVEGTFSQYPLRLAWAITIHKSQGLTFDKAVLDVNAAFASGQVYVALSRCRSLEGLVLTAPLWPQSVITDEAVNRYVDAELQQSQLAEQNLDKLKRDYYYMLLNELFDFHQLDWDLRRVQRIYDEFLYRLYPQQLERCKTATQTLKTSILEVADKFRNQYTLLLQQTAHYETDEVLRERIQRASVYFLSSLETSVGMLLPSLQAETDNQEVKRRLKEALYDLQQTCFLKKATLESVQQHGFSVTSYLKDKAMALLKAEEQSAKRAASSKRKKEPKKLPVAEKRPVEKLPVPEDILHPVLFQRLREWRYEKSQELGCPAFHILFQRALITIVNTLPTTADELLTVPAFGKASLLKFGKEILAIVKDFMEDDLPTENSFKPRS